MAVVLRTNWCTTICITCPILHKIECNKFACNKFVLVLLQIDIIQSLFIGWLSVKEVEGSTENCLCLTGGERTVVKKSCKNFSGMTVFVSSNTLL